MKIRAFIKKYIPLPAVAAFVLAVIIAVLYTVSLYNSPFADFLNGTLSYAYRAVMSFLTVIFPFSVFEIICILALPAVVVAVIFVVRRGRDFFLRAVFSLLGVIAVLFSAYSLGIGIGYHTTPIAQRCDFAEDRDITSEELERTLIYLREKVNVLGEELSDTEGQSSMDCSFTELCERLVDSYGKLSEEHPVIQNFYSRAKPMVFSTVMSDAGLLGMYTFFTGEANVNVEYPDYTVVFTTAHELAHQRGISRENEANFIAFLVCIGSEDEYIRYCGYLNMYEYVANALYKTDKELYRDINASLCDVARADMRASGEISRAHRDSLLNKIADALNDGYLKMNGTEGTVSYGYVVRLGVGYILNEEE